MAHSPTTRAARTGADYLRSLRDGREVFLDGRRVDDVTTEPGLAAASHTVARMYDRAAARGPEDGWSAFADANGRRCPGAWIRPTDAATLASRQRFSEAVARATGGLFARTPEYVPLVLLGILDQRDEFDAVSPTTRGNLERYWTDACERDLALCHAVVDIQIRPNVPLEETPILRIVHRGSDGIVIRGLKGVVTFAPQADECLVVPFGRDRELPDECVFYCAVPMNAPGLRIVARAPTVAGVSFEDPVSQLGEENDAALVFDDVFVPWGRVLGLADAAFVQRILRRMLDWSYWSVLLRLAVKAELMVGLFSLVPEALGRDRDPMAREALAEAIRYLTTIRAFLEAANATAIRTTGGHWLPNPDFITAGRAYSVEHYRRIIERMQDVAGQGLIALPREHVFDEPSIGPVLDRAYSSAGTSSRRKARLVRLASDLTVSAHAGRQTMFELLNAMPWQAQRAVLAAGVDLAPHRQFAEAVAGLSDPGELVSDVAEPERRSVSH
jgi:4-hydroxyphenylacetate 3-monooxygenase